MEVGKKLEKLIGMSPEEMDRTSLEDLGISREELMSYIRGIPNERLKGVFEWIRESGLINSDENTEKFVKLMQEVVRRGADGNVVAEVLEGLKSPEKIGKASMKKRIMALGGEPENYDYSKLVEGDNEVIFVYDRRIPSHELDRIRGMFLDEFEQRKEQLGDVVYFTVHKQTPKKRTSYDFAAFSYWDDMGGIIDPVRKGFVDMSADRLRRYKDDEKRYIIRHETIEASLDINDIERECKIKIDEDLKLILPWYLTMRNAIVDTVSISENPRFGKTFFKSGEREIGGSESLIRRNMEVGEFTQKAKSLKIPEYSSVLNSMFYLQWTGPFWLTQETVEGGFRGAFKSYYGRLDNVSRTAERQLGPVGTEFRYSLQDRLRGFSIKDNKIDEDFMKGTYDFIVGFIEDI